MKNRKRKKEGESLKDEWSAQLNKDVIICPWETTCKVLIKRLYQTGLLMENREIMDSKDQFLQMEEQSNSLCEYSGDCEGGLYLLRVENWHFLISTAVKSHIATVRLQCHLAQDPSSSIFISAVFPFFSPHYGGKTKCNQPNHE